MKKTKISGFYEPPTYRQSQRRTEFAASAYSVAPSSPPDHDVFYVPQGTRSENRLPPVLAGFYRHITHENAAVTLIATKLPVM